jgi:SAM-dependent methyltransferase
MTAPANSSWIESILGGAVPAEGESAIRQGRTILRDGAILRDEALVARDQAQTRDAFAFKWGKRDTYASDAMRGAMRQWLADRYGDLIGDLKAHSGKPIVLDAGCGAGFTGSLLFSEHLNHLRYVGADISRSVEIAAETLGPLTAESLFIQGDLMRLPFTPGSFDLVYSEGVMHHTPSTRDAVAALARLVRPGGIFAFYVYAKKSPLREFSDDYVRSLVADLAPQQAWDLLMPLTRLGQALGELNVEFDVPENVAVLGIPKGRINLQRFFYWHICKAYYRPDFTLDEMNHVNFDWFMPKYCHRQTPDEVKAWCGESGLAIERLKVEEAGITVVARRLETTA